LSSAEKALHIMNDPIDVPKPHIVIFSTKIRFLLMLHEYQRWLD